MRALYHVPQRPRLAALAVAALCLALIAPLLPQQFASAQALVTVTNGNNSGAGSLREAVNNVSTGGIITVSDSVTEILLTEQITINTSLTINGHGVDTLFIQGDGSERIFDITGSDTEVFISGVNVSGGGNVILGGGIRTEGMLTITNSTISDNTVTGSDASGGGIYNSGTLEILNSTIAGNTADTGGGGIENRGILIITNSSISDNHVNGDSTYGGGIGNWEYLTITNSTISGNTSASVGGGILHGIDNTTTIISHSTITDNSAGDGGGIYVYDGGTVTLSNSIIAGNRTGGDCGFYSDLLTSTGHNIDGDGSCFLTEPTDQSATDPELGDLADNGGPTLTHAITETSPAYNAGGEKCATETDQRGIERPQLGACDIGAYELAGAPELFLPDDMTVPATNPQGAVVEFAPTATNFNDELIDVFCEPVSGTLFTIGTTEVECSAEDSFEQTTTGSFFITVLGSDTLLAALIEDTTGSTIPAYLKPRLLALLTTADRALERGQTVVACHTLAQFSVQIDTLSPRYISSALADQLSGDVLSIRQALDC